MEMPSRILSNDENVMLKTKEEQTDQNFKVGARFRMMGFLLLAGIILLTGFWKQSFRMPFLRLNGSSDCYRISTTQNKASTYF